MSNAFEIQALAREVRADAEQLRGPLVDEVWSALPLALLIVGIPAWVRAVARMNAATTALKKKTARLRAMTSDLRHPAAHTTY